MRPDKIGAFQDMLQEYEIRGDIKVNGRRWVFDNQWLLEVVIEVKKKVIHVIVDPVDTDTPKKFILKEIEKSLQ